MKIKQWCEWLLSFYNIWAKCSLKKNSKWEKFKINLVKIYTSFLIQMFIYLFTGIYLFTYLNNLEKKTYYKKKKIEGTNENFFQDVVLWPQILVIWQFYISERFDLESWKLAERCSLVILTVPNISSFVATASIFFPFSKF